jgi:outer membrane protein OmpA-like peptidoglycan-associated protein
MAFIPFVRAQVASRLPQPVDFRVRQALEIQRFSEFVTDISPKQKDEIEQLAREIVRSNSTNDPIYAFRVEGHADIARTIPVGQRTQFENEISEERAENGFRLLVEALERIGGKALAEKIARDSKAFGMGTQRLKIPNAITKDQFEQNRRAVFFVQQVTYIQPGPPPPPPPTSVIEDRFTVQLVKSATVTKTITPSLKVVDFGIEGIILAATLEIVDTIDKKRATFNVFATGVGVSIGPPQLPAGSQIVFSPGPPVKFKIFRLLGKNRVHIDLNSFVGSVTVFINAGTSPGGTQSVGGALSFSFDALEAAGVNTQPTLVMAPSGSSSLSTPSVGGGDVLPLARMIMIGTPSDL